MLRYIIGISFLAVVIILLRRLIEGKILKKHQYAIWLIIPVYMLLFPFLCINIPVPDNLSAFFAATEKAVIKTVSDTEETAALPAAEQSASKVYAGDQQEASVQHENADSTKTLPVQANSITVDWSLVFKTVSLSVSAIMIIALAVYNTGFILYCREHRKLIGKDPMSGLDIYSIDHKGTPFLLLNKIYVDDEPERMSKYIICHEASHYKHRDHLWIVLRYLVLAVNWYNPLIWISFFLSGRDCELACDEEVISQYGKESSTDYARSLFELLQQRSVSPVGFTLSTEMRGSYKTMKKRISSLKNPVKNNTTVLVLSLLSILIISGCALINPTAASKETTSTDTTSSSEEKTYDITSNWKFESMTSGGETFKESDLNEDEIPLIIFYEELGQKDSYHVICRLNGIELWSFMSKENGLYSFEDYDRDRKITAKFEGDKLILMTKDKNDLSIVFRHTDEQILLPVNENPGPIYIKAKMIDNCKVEITNTEANTVYSYDDSFFRLEVQKNGKWYYVRQKAYFFRTLTNHLTNIDPFETKTEEYDLFRDYDTLAPGEYRLAVFREDANIYAYFTVNEDGSFSYPE